MTTIAVVSAGLSEPSSTRLLADRLAESAVTAIGQQGGPVQVAHIDLRPLAHEVVDAMLTGFQAPALAAATATVVEADALVFVSPVFTAGMSGLAKSFLDVIDKDALVDMPVLLAATGGTARHSLAIEHAMRPVFALPARGRRAHRGVRRDRRLGHPGRPGGSGRTHPPGRCRPGVGDRGLPSGPAAGGRAARGPRLREPARRPRPLGAGAAAAARAGARCACVRRRLLARWRRPRICRRSAAVSTVGRRLGARPTLSTSAG